MLLTAKTCITNLNHFWLHLKLQTQKILVILVLVIILITNATVLSITTLDNFLPKGKINTNINDISLLMHNSILLLVNEKRNIEITSFCERIYKNANGIRYIVYISRDGFTYGIPYNYEEIFPFFSTSVSDIKIPSRNFFSRFLKFPFSNTTNVITYSIPILDSEQFSYGLLIIGTDFTFSLLINTFLLMNQIIFVFILLLFLIFFFGVTIVSVTITQPLTELSEGLRTIAAGNFSTKINLRAGGQLGELIGNFNELNRRLKLYEQKNTEQLRSEKLKLETLITTITDGVLLLDANLKIVFVNTTAIKMLGWKTKKNLLNTSIWDHFPISFQKELFVALQNVVSGKQASSFDSSIESNLISSEQRLIRVTLKIVYDSFDLNKLPLGVGLTIQDRTKEFEFDLVQTRFISNISHELRTPLFNIKSFIETIQEYDYTLSTWQKRYFLDIVNKETNRLTRLVNDILCISKLDSRNEISLFIVNISEIIQQTLTNYQLVAHDKKIYLHFESFATNVNISGNKDLLLQVLMNLIGNALKFTYQNGEIIVRLYELKNKKIRIEVVDTGIGIADVYQPYIFQRFYRIENEVHTLKGAGLGLSIVNTILAEHKTCIKIVSRYGIGSVFWFDLFKSK